VEISAAKAGGPSMDWLNTELGYLQSQRSKAKVRAWFNALAQQSTIARGREAVEKLLQREGRTAVKLDELAGRLGFKHADALFEVVGKDEYSLRNIETLLRPSETVPSSEDRIALKPSRPASGSSGDVLVVGVDSLLTVLARCCRPAPPDPIVGFVTKGKGVAVHRTVCGHLAQLAQRSPERLIAVEWGKAREGAATQYPVDVAIEALDRQGLLRDISEVFAKEKTNVVAAATQSRRGAHGALARMTFTVEVADAMRLKPVLDTVARIPGVRSARRR